MGLIAIPGMMTGAVLGGSSVDQAAKLQMIIIFMISASTALASMFTTLCAIVMVVDEEGRIRIDRLDTRPLGTVIHESFKSGLAAVRGMSWNWRKSWHPGAVGDERDLLLPLGGA